MRQPVRGALQAPTAARGAVKRFPQSGFDRPNDGARRTDKLCSVMEDEVMKRETARCDNDRSNTDAAQALRSIASLSRECRRHLMSATLCAMLAVAVLLPSLASSAQGIEVLWLGHSTTRITSQTGKVILIDPALTKTPTVPPKYKDLKALGKVDLILVTHGHGDHIHDLVDMAKLSGAVVVANFEFALQLVNLGVLDAKRTIAMNKGGTVMPLGRDIKIHMVPAEHSSSVDANFFSSERLKGGTPRFLEGGAAVGYVVELENGFRIYHSGDTHVFGDMVLIHRFHRPDLALVSIGGHYTMDPRDAAYALRELIKPKEVIPIHYGTYPVINRTPAELKSALGDSPIKMLDVKPGQAVRY